MKRFLRLGDSYALTKHKPRDFNIRYISLMAAALFMCLTARGQDASRVLPITGTVVDTAGQPIQGATVSILGASGQTQTDEYGRFAIRSTVGEGTLRVRFVGYESLEVPFEGTTAEPIWIALTPTENLIEEVEVSTGYQTIPKERATGSFEFVGNELFNRSIGGDVLSRLDGITNSMLFDKRDPNNTNIQIRGLGTLTQHMAEPLIVVDNFPYEGNINDINPNDVENIVVLKDAAASSIWGARAANGVIIVTTKKGVRGQSNRLNVSANMTLVEKPDLFKLPEIDPVEYIELEKFLYEQGYFNSLLQNRTTFPALTPIVEILAAGEEGRLSDEETYNAIETLKSHDARDDFQRYIYRLKISQQYNAAISGGTDDVSYFVSAGLDQINSELVGNSSRRISLRTNTTYRPSKNLNFQLGIGYTDHYQSQNSLGEYGSAAYSFGNRRMPVYTALADDVGKPMDIDRNYRALYTDTVGNGRLHDWKFRPLQEMQLNDKNLRNQSLSANFAVNYKVISPLEVSVKYQYQKSNGKDVYNHVKEGYFARNLINLFSRIEQDDVHYGVPNEGILDLTASSMQSHNLRGQVNFNKAMGAQEVSAFIGAELREVNNNSNSYRTYGYSEVLTTSNVDFVNRQPTFGGLAGNINVPNSQFFTDITNRFTSVYANFGYSLSDKYHITASARKDASNLFGVKANRRGVPLWSAGLKWEISEEEFYAGSVLPRLGIRLTYGYGGNINPYMSAFTTINYRGGGQQPTNIPYAAISQRPNPNLTWEKTRTVNAAIDFSFWENIVTGSLEYFNKKSLDVIGAEPLDPTVGTNSLMTNSANIRGEGIDLQLRSNIIGNRKLKWNLITNFNYVTYRVSRYLTDRSMNGYVSNGAMIAPFEGYHPYLVVTHRWAGLNPETGDPMGYLNGEASQNYTELLRQPIENQMINGPALPPFFGNVLNDFKFGNLSLSFNITYKLGHYNILPSVNYTQVYGGGVVHKDYLSRWIKPGDEKATNVPSMIYPNPSSIRDSFYAFSETLAFNSSYVKLSDVRVSYNLDIPRLGTKVQLYGFFSNLNLLIWKADDRVYDPEYYTGTLPSNSFSFGAKFDF